MSVNDGHLEKQSRTNETRTNSCRDWSGLLSMVRKQVVESGEGGRAAFDCSTQRRCQMSRRRALDLARGGIHAWVLRRQPHHTYCHEDDSLQCLPDANPVHYQRVSAVQHILCQPVNTFQLMPMNRQRNTGFGLPSEERLTLNRPLVNRLSAVHPRLEQGEDTPGEPEVFVKIGV